VGTKTKLAGQAAAASTPLIPYVVGGLALYLGYRYLAGTVPDIGRALGDAAGDVKAGFLAGDSPIEETVTRREVLGYDQAGDDDWFGVSPEGYVQTLTGPNPGTIESSTVPQYSTVDRDGELVVTVDEPAAWTGGPRMYRVVPESGGSGVGRWFRKRADMFVTAPWEQEYPITGPVLGGLKRLVWGD
jgi:hypothetical protein